MLLEIIIALIAGFLVKVVDWFDDTLKSRSPAKYALALAYGVLIGYLIGNATFSVLFLAALVAQVLARKIDTQAHRIGFATSVVTALFFAVPSIDFLFFGYFLLLAFLDEVDFIGRLRFLETHRIILPLGALPLVLIGRWDYFVGIVAFDVGYELFNIIQYKMKARG